MASKTLSNDQHRLLRRVKKVAYLIGLFLAMTIICLPGLWIVLSSLRPPVEIMAKPPVWIPQEITLDAYYAMFSGAGGGGIPVWDYFRNSLIISVTSTIIALIVGVSGGYAFARFRFWGKSPCRCRSSCSIRASALSTRISVSLSLMWRSMCHSRSG
jgi:multiple sugar transport system permease protein